METNTAFRILGIDNTRDESIISEAYHRLLPSHNPEDDPEGFKRLRMAYETAMSYARKPELETMSDSEPVTDIDKWIKKAENIYNDILTRADISCWDEILSDDICINLDTSMEVREKFLVFLMDNHYLPYEVWEKINEVFTISEDREMLTENFPPDFLDYILYYANNEGLDGIMPFDLFEYISLDGESAKPDSYIEALLNIRRRIDAGEGERCIEALDDLKDYDIYHPVEDVEKLRVYIKYFENEAEAAELRKANTELPDNEKQSVPEENPQLIEKCKNVFRQLTDSLSDLPVDYTYAYTYIGEALWYLGETDRAYALWQDVLKHRPKMYHAKYCVARYLYESGQYEEAGALVEELGQENETDMALYALLNKINKVLIEIYQGQIERGEENEKHPGQKLKLELGWKLWQNERVDEAVELLESFEPDEDCEYGYNNLFGRILYQKKEYSRAVVYLQKWKKMLWELDGLTPEEKDKRIKRRCLAYRCLAGCLAELGENEEAEECIKQACELTDNRVEKIQSLCQYAAMLLRWERYNDCVDVCDRVISEDRQYYPAYLIHQEACYELRKAREVVEDYENSVSIVNDYFKPYMYAALVYYYYGQYDDSMKVLDAARENEVIFTLKMRLLDIQVKRHLTKSLEDREKLIKDLDILQAELQERISQGSKYDETVEIIYGLRKEELPDLDEIYCEKAFVYEGCNKYEEACEEIDKAIKLSDNARYYSIKGDILSADGNQRDNSRFNAAAACYEKAISEGIDDNPWIYYSLGYCYERMHNMDQAVEEYKKALELKAPFENVCERLVDYYLDEYARTHKMIYLNQAVSYADIELEADKTEYSLWLKGKTLEYGFDMKEAAAYYEKALEIEDSYYVALLRLGNCYRRMMQYDKSIKYLEKSIECLNGRRRPQPYINLGMSYECNEEYEQAVDCYKKAIDNGADEEEMWQNIGDCYRYMENYSAAMEAYEHAEKREYNINCSEIAFAKGEYKRAEQLYKKAIFKLQAEISKASNYIGSGYREKLGKLASELGFKHVLFGDFYLEYFQAYKKAAACYEKAVYYDKSDESVWKAYVGMIKVYFMADKPKKARKCAEIAKAAFERLYGVTEEEFLVTAPYRAIYMGRFGWTYLGLGDTEKALYYFKEMDRTTLCANCRCHGCYEAQLFQGIVYYVLGDMDKAQQAFREAVKRNPHDVFSMKMLAKVEK